MQVCCPECSKDCPSTAAICDGCGLSLSSAVAVGAMRTAIQGSGTSDADAGDSMPTSILIGGSVARVGQVMGSYRLIDLLGEGGMGAVYLAEHVKLGRKVALKMLHRRYADTPEVVHRFFAEARAVNKIFHEHIVEITDFVENDEHHNYFIMEYLRGQALGELITSEGALPLARSIGIVVQVCSALSAVHEAGIVHRDLKPDNIFLTERGGQEDFVKLLDFGIAKLIDNTGQTIKLQTTAAGIVMGTPEYMSPEQSRGREIDYRTDIYSLGIILYELATGTKPFHAETFGELVIAHATEAPTTPSKVPGLVQDIPRPLDELILHCLAKEPQNRPATTKEVERRLREIAEQHACSLESFDVHTKMFSSRLKRRAFVGAAALAIVAAVAIPWLSRSSDHASAHAEQPEAAAAAPAAEPTPSPAPAPPPPLPVPPEHVSITFNSVPSGASVFAAGGDHALGETPLTIELGYSHHKVRYEFRKDGFASMEQEVSLSRDAQLAVVLAPETRRHRARARARSRRKAAASTKSTPTKRSHKLRDGAVINPFGN
jgi:eukaryotic-like serine/threonine-protein kinase